MAVSSQTCPMQLPAAFSFPLLVEPVVFITRSGALSQETPNVARQNPFVLRVAMYEILLLMRWSQLNDKTDSKRAPMGVTGNVACTFERGNSVFFVIRV